jgi:hypothetical protein
VRPLYERRDSFEAYNKGLSFVPTNEFAWFRATVSKDRPARTLTENADVAKRVLAWCRARARIPAASVFATIATSRGGARLW